MYYIYVIINKITNKIYVGQTTNLHDRWSKHCSCARNEYNHPLYNSMRKHGVDNFIFEQIEQLDTLDACNKAEEDWIQYLQTRDRRFGYNIAFGGANRTTSQETKDKLSMLNSGEGNPFYGKKHTEETKQKIADCRLNTTHSEETKQKMSESRTGEKNGMFGRKHTPETLQKMSDAKKGKYDGEKNPMFGKKGELAPMFGKQHSPETKEKISQANKRRAANKLK